MRMDGPNLSGALSPVKSTTGPTSSEIPMDMDLLPDRSGHAISDLDSYLDPRTICATETDNKQLDTLFIFVNR